MSTANPTNRGTITKLVICVHFCAALVIAQSAQDPPAQQADEVIKVYTELVQTDVMVFDKQGHFVEGLNRENFELRVDGKLQPIRFFDLVRVGSTNEEEQLAAARGVPLPLKAGAGVPAPLDRGRPIFFFVDDMHLSPASTDQTRKLLTRFIDRDLKQNDEAEILSASGRVGFLQQLTDNKVVLRTALERLASRVGVMRDFQRPPMSEYEALQIDRGDRDTLGYFVDALVRDYPQIGAASAEDQVKQRASTILHQAAYLATTTLSSLDSLIRSCARLPGRKLIFLISDGFFIDNRNSDSSERMRLLISAAGRSGTVIYSIDARGLIASLTDASSEPSVDMSGRLVRAGQGEMHASQDALNALARDTGGRALFNTNDLHIAIANGLQETATYYLLAWRPAREGNDSKFQRLECSVVGRPDLTVRVRRGFFDLEPAPVGSKSKPQRNQKGGEPTVAAKLKEAIIAPYPDRQIPISLSLNYLDTPDKGTTLYTSTQVPAEFLTFNSQDRKDKTVDLAGAVFNVQGELADRFDERITVTGPAAANKGGSVNVTHSSSVFLSPGLYQARVAARDATTGLVGSANTWIEIPDLSNHKLTLSSLIAGERSSPGETIAEANSGPLSPKVLLSVDRHFKRGSFLRYLVFVYNSARASADSVPDVAIQMQVLRDDQPVVTTPLRKISTEGILDLQRLPYAAEFPLAAFPAGQYVLKLTAIDRVARSSASQQLRFEIQ